jgi:hypothetical protein
MDNYLKNMELHKQNNYDIIQFKTGEYQKIAI